MLVRLMRVAVQQNTALEERTARGKDDALVELEALRADILRIIKDEGGRRGERIARAVDQRFGEADFPFLGDRPIPRIAVSGSAGDLTLEAGLRHPTPWSESSKLALIARGYALLDDELRARA
jgi:hypothetical protein